MFKPSEIKKGSVFAETLTTSEWELTGSNRRPTACKTEKTYFQILTVMSSCLAKATPLLVYIEFIPKLAIDKITVVFKKHESNHVSNY